MKPKGKAASDEMRAEYDFDYSKGVRGKYYERIMREGIKVVVLKAKRRPRRLSSPGNGRKRANA